MELFASARERRLWALAGVVVAGVYATLGAAGELAAELGDRGLLDTVFFGAFVVLMVALVVTARRKGVRDRDLGLLVAVGAAGVILVVRLGIPAAERTHLVEYSIIALLIYEALAERTRHGRAVRHPAGMAFAATTVIGIVDEGLQAVIPNRVFDPVDIGFNMVAAGTAVVLAAALRPRVASPP